MPDSANSTAVDLSRLPAPEVIEQLSFETIFADLVASVQSYLPSFDATVESEPVVKLLQVFAYREVMLRQQFNDRARSVMTAYATGSDLDQLAALVGVTRLVITPEDIDAGTPAVLESDEALRSRVVLAPESFSVAGPELAYVFHGRSAHPDVLDASATSPTPGEVVVTVLSRQGDGTADPEVLDAVEARVNGREVRPLTDSVSVVSATIIEFTIEAELTLFAGPDPTVVLNAAEASLADFLAASRRLSRDVNLSGIYAALHVQGVQKVVLSEPAADIPIDATEAPWCTGSTLTYAGNGD